jgi:hypothetical protein
MPLRSTRMASVVLALCFLMAACSGGGSPDKTSTPSPTIPSYDPSTRPSSPAVLRILEPKNGQVVHGTSAPLKMSLQNAKIVPASTTHIVGTQGHIHVILDNTLVSMTYGLHQTLDNLKPGTHLLRAQFVASDHAPFNPPVFAQAVTFTVKP